MVLVCALEESIQRMSTEQKRPHMMETEIQTLPRKKNMKYELPSYFCIKRFQFDVAKLRQAVHDLNVPFTNVIESNPGLCSNNHKLVESVYDHYEQISLTECSKRSLVNFTLEDCLRMGKNAGLDKGLSKHKKYQLKLQRRNETPELDEYNYNVPTSYYKNSYFQKCVEQLKSQVIRVRIVKLKAGKTVDWHIDYDPTYATRLIVAIQTHPKVVNLTKRRNKIETVHIPSDGHPWFLNTGFSHSVENNGEEDRIILMFSLSGDQLLREISGAWKAGHQFLL